MFDGSSGDQPNDSWKCCYHHRGRRRRHHHQHHTDLLGNKIQIGRFVFLFTNRCLRFLVLLLFQHPISCHSKFSSLAHNSNSSRFPMWYSARADILWITEHTKQRNLKWSIASINFKPISQKEIVCHCNRNNSIWYIEVVAATATATAA